VGSRLPPRACCDRRKLSLRNRLIAAAVGIVGVSLLLSGALTWVLVRDVELQGAQDQLDRSIATDVALVRQQECRGLQAGCDPVDAQTFESRLQSLVVPSLGGDRLLLLKGNTRRILFDSAGSATGQILSIAASRRVAGIADAQPVFEGQPYLAAAAPIAAARDPLGASFVVIARRQSAISAAAASELIPRLLLAGGAALLLALILVLLVSRSITRPMTQLARAAEDIAAGNYSRRVGVTSGDEIGVVGRSFNRMGEAVERVRTLQRDFLANVSHELKTPLTSLIGFSQALVDGSIEEPAERKRAAEIIHEEARRVLRMSQELLDLARVESGQYPLHPTDVDIRALLDQEMEIVRPRAAARLLEIHLQVPAGLRPVRADVERLHQIVANLLDNAVKYATPGDPVVVAVENGVQNVEISVTNGVGQRPPDAERIFDRFYRGDPSRPSAGGVGLGLSISRELASSLGGRLWAELEGTRLRLRLTLPAAN